MIALVLSVFLIGGPITEAEKADAVRQAASIRSQFDAELFDYTTARFRDVRATVNGDVEGRRGAYFCGFVNSKNRLGAYVGWQPFVASGGEAPMIIVGGSGDVMDGVRQTMCGENDPSDPTDRSALLTFR